MTFARSFMLDGFDELLPAGRYELVSHQDTLDGMILPDCLLGSVVIHLHALPGYPGLARTLTVSWDELESALMRDRSPAVQAVAAELDAMMADPMTHLVMLSDGVSEAEVRAIVGLAASRRRSSARGRR